MSDPMRLKLLALPLFALGAFVPPTQACDGRAEVEAAFVKQQEKPWRTRIVSESDAGLAQEQIFAYQPPNRMHRTVTVGDQVVETIGVNRWAWSADNGAWAEMDAAQARVVAIHILNTFQPPKAGVDFKCLGDVSYEGKTYLGYQSPPETGEDGTVLARTIYVDPETRLPAFNVVGAPDGSAKPLHREEFSYPTDINIIPPMGNRDLEAQP